MIIRGEAKPSRDFHFSVNTWPLNTVNKFTVPGPGRDRRVESAAAMNATAQRLAKKEKTHR